MNKLIYLLFFIPTISFCQVTDFDRLESEGSVPKDFTELFSAKFERDYGENENEELDKDFFLGTRFYIDQLLQSGKILFNDPHSLWIKEVAQYLLKDEEEVFNKLRFYVLRSNAVNAFCTDQGIIVFTSGLLAQLENEAQLAYILGHEISHFTEKHSRKGYIEYKDYEKSKGRYRRLSYYDAINRMSLYEKDQEFEADVKGMELYLKSDYDPKEIENAFMSLHFGYLPFDDRNFDRNFLASENLQLPDFLFPEFIDPIEFNFDFDDHLSTHPNIQKRIDATNDFLKNKDNHKTEKFHVLDEKKFDEIQTVMRFECVNINLSERFYGDALYNIFLLSIDYPNNRFLDISKVKALYGLAKYKNRGRFTEVTPKLTEIEGQSYALHYLINELSQEALNVLVYRHLYDMTIAYPNDLEFREYYKDFEKEFALNSQINFNDLKAIRLEDDKLNLNKEFAFDVSDSIRKVENSSLSKIRKAELIKELYQYSEKQFAEDPEKQFENYGLSDLVANSDFVKNLNNLRGKLEIEQIRNDSLEEERKANVKRKGYRLGISKVMVVDPIYEDYTLNKDQKYLAAEKRKIEISQSYTKKYKRLDIDVKILDSKSINEQQVMKYNEIALIKDWMTEVLDHDGIDMLSSSHFRMKEIEKKYNVSNFLFTGFYNYAEMNGLKKPHIIMIGTVYLAPIAIFNMMMTQKKFQMVSFEISSTNDQVEMLAIQDVNLKGTSKVIRSYIFNLLCQIYYDNEDN